jgi:hypothetical protein
VESQYAFVTTITSSWLPVYSVTHRVELRSDGQTVAIAKETVLGGGLIGKYMRGFGGGQDAEFISCGYTGGQVGHWRPNDASDPRYREYQATDNAFVLRALGRR